MNDGTSYGVGWSGTFCGERGDKELTRGVEKRCEGTERCEERSGTERVMNDDGAYVP